MTQMVSCQNQPRSLKQRHPTGGRWPDSLWLRLCLFAMAIFEVDASLKWMPWQSKLKSGTCLTKNEDPTVKVYLTIGQGAAAAKVLSCVSLCVTPWTVAHQVPLPMGLFQVRILEWVAISYSTGQSESVPNHHHHESES